MDDISHFLCTAAYSNPEFTPLLLKPSQETSRAHLTPNQITFSLTHDEDQMIVLTRV